MNDVVAKFDLGTGSGLYNKRFGVTARLALFIPTFGIWAAD